MCKTPHKHAELIKAWADGATIQYYRKDLGLWKDCGENRHCWNKDMEYRIKPEPSDLEKYDVEVGDVWRLCSSVRNPLGYTCHTVAKLTGVPNHYRCTEGSVRAVADNMTLMFRRGVVNKL